MQKETRKAKKLTVFSFEEGTGRTMLVLNIGKMFVKERKKTLIIETQAWMNLHYFS